MHQGAHLLAHGMAQLPLEDRIGGGERLGQIPQIVGLIELMTTARQAAATAGTNSVCLSLSTGQNRPLQVPQGSEEGLERGLIQLRQLPTGCSVSPVDKSRMNQICGSPLGREAIQGDDQAALLR